MTSITKYSPFFLILVLGSCMFLSGCSAPVTIPTEAPGGSPDACGMSRESIVTRTMDGDTLAVRYSDGREETVRVLGIDTPETEDHGNWGSEFSGISNPSYLTEWGIKASEHTRSLAKGKSVTLTADCQAEDYDQYGRLLSYVDVDGSDLGATLIREGYARVYTAQAFERKSQYLSLQSEAQRSGAGLWNTEQKPDEKETGPVAITKVQYDPPGEDRENLNGEFIVLSSTETRDLYGWTISDNSGTLYTFRHVIITPDSPITLHAGRGTPTTTDLYWNLDEPLLGNNGDSVTLRDSDRDVIALYQWGN